jgi:hypothetical protein
MPKLGKKHYPYTKAGQAAYKKAKAGKKPKGGAKPKRRAKK